MVTSLTELLTPVQELPLHQAILMNDEARALALINTSGQFDLYKNNVGHILADCELTSEGIKTSDGVLSIKRVYHNPAMEPINRNVVEQPIFLELAAFSNQFGKRYSQGRVTLEDEFYPGEINLGTVNGPFAYFQGVSKNGYTLIDPINPNNIFLRDRERNQTAIHLAAANGMLEVARALLEKGMPPDLIDGQGWTALFHACAKGDEPMIYLLVSKGADIRLSDKVSYSRPIIALDPAKTYSDATISLLSEPDPLNPQSKAREPNQLHKIIAQTNFRVQEDRARLQSLARSPSLLVRSPRGKLPSELLRQKQELLSQHDNIDLDDRLIAYLSFRACSKSFKYQTNKCQNNHLCTGM